MYRRRLLILMSTATLVAMAGFALFLCLMSPTPGVTRENFRRLRKGMSAREVEALLGEANNAAELVEGVTTGLWGNQEVAIFLIFDSDGLCFGQANSPGQYFRHHENLRKDESLLDRMRRWLPW